MRFTDRHSGWGRTAIVVLMLTIALVSAGVLARELPTRPDLLEPELLTRVMQLPSDTTVDITIRCYGSPSADELTHFLDSAYSTLSDKRRAGLRILRSAAAAAQGPMLETLSRLELSGLARGIDASWLTNSITATIAVAAIDSLTVPVGVQSLRLTAEPAHNPPIVFQPQAASLAPLGVEPNLTCIGADTAWHMGFTGRGRIVCIFDYTGVDGSHPALAANWKGRDGDSAAAWSGSGKYPKYDRDFYSLDTTHGTSLAGILFGHDDLTGDTTGVAPDAKWIAANWPRFDWAANPDGDFNTTDDMPDVINISMGSTMGCGLWSDAIDMVEALGIVVIIAAGNTGPDSATTWEPANRALDSLTNFAVGSINYWSREIVTSSSRGPSPCNMRSIKPNVAAPGNGIRTAVPGGYQLRGGTSMAAPHVAGAVAILRQYAPNATSRQIKEALLAGATPAGVGHPNNQYGWGIISIPKAMQFLSRRPSADLRISVFNCPRVNVWDTVVASLQMTNYGEPLDSVFAVFHQPHSGIRLITDSVYFGAVGFEDNIQGQVELRCLFDDTLVGGPTFQVPYSIFGSGGYRDTGSIRIAAGIPGKGWEKFISGDNWWLQVRNVGGFYLNQQFLTSYPDSCLNGCVDTMLWSWDFEIGLLAATGADRVSDFDRIGYGHLDGWIDSSWVPVTTKPGASSDIETICRFNDGLAPNQIGIEIGQHTYSWLSGSEGRVILLEYELRNPTTKTINSLRVGICTRTMGLWTGMDFDPTDTVLTAQADAEYRMGYFSAQSSELDTSRCFGVAVLSGPGTWSYSIAHRSWTSHVSDSELYATMVSAVPDTITYSTGAYADRLEQTTSTGPFTLAPGQCDTALFALMLADSPGELTRKARFARAQYTRISPYQNLPETFQLRQNYPNPFNPATNIEFDLPHGSHVTLTVYNILGQVVATLIDSDLPPGRHLAAWDGVNDRKRTAASGVYFYRLVTDRFTETRKMILLR